MQANRPIIESVRDYLLSCQLMKDGKINIDYLGNGIEFSIDPIGCDPVYKQYTDGTCQKQFQFAISSKKAFDGDARTGIANSGLYQNLEEWVTGNNMSDIFPELDKYVPIRVEVMQSGFLFSTEADLGRYQIICRLIYE